MNLNRELKKIRTEDFVWIIYFFIVIAALYSNRYEVNYLLNNDINSLKKEKTLNIIIFVVAFFIYLYFVLTFSEDLSNMEKNFNNRRYRETFIKLIAALLFLVGGALYAIVEITSFSSDEVGLP